MKFEGPDLGHPKPEQEKELFQRHLSKIIATPLTVENIHSFAPEALDELVELTHAITSAYEKRTPDLPNNKRHVEDAAYSYYGLEDIDGLLQRISAKVSQTQSIFEFIEKNTHHQDIVITPPDEIPATIGAGGERFEEKNLLPRLATLLYILESDFEIPKEEITIVEGGITDTMMRKHPYFRIEIDDLERVVYVCDEEGNASYVFDRKLISEQSVSIDTLDQMTKEMKNSLLLQIPGIGKRVIQTSQWRMIMHTLLAEPIPVSDQVDEIEGITYSENISEFRKTEEFLPFDEFVAKVQEIYPGTGSTKIWYADEYKKHSNWPSNPQRTYRKSGWKGWPAMVNRESHLEKEFLSYKQLVDVVTALYPKYVPIKEWYQEERKKHKDWPSRPESAYKETWKDWRTFVGLSELLSFDKFTQEVRGAYPGTGDIQRWYKQSVKNHEAWPGNPQDYYADQWKGWPELVGIENRQKKEYPAYAKFVSEVRKAYSGERNIKEWYATERKKHPNWPSNPDKYYKDAGWNAWLEFVKSEE